MLEKAAGFEPAGPPVVELLPGQAQPEAAKADSRGFQDSTPCSPSSDTAVRCFTGSGSAATTVQPRKLASGPRPVPLARRSRHVPIPANIMWQWEHKTGFRDYSATQNAKIEYAYQLGDATVHLKTGKAGTTPMQIFFTDMLQYDVMTGNSRRIRRNGSNSYYMRVRRFIMEIVRSFETGQPRKQTIKKYQKRQQALEASEEAFDARTLHGDNICARMAESFTFSLLSTTLVFLNVIWIGVDVDLNQAPTIEEAATEFQAVEYIFCSCFTAELLIRFCAFRRKRDFIRDAWFCFDALLVLLMFIESFLLRVLRLAMQSATGGDGGSTFRNVTVLRMARLLKLTRMTRLLRALPELLTMLRGIVTALRSVMFTLVLQLLLLYVFGIFFCTWTRGHNMTMLDEYFGSLSAAMFTLLVRGTFMDGPSEPLTRIQEAQSPTLFSLFLFFIILSSFTVLNMLVGILFQVVADVSEGETLKMQTYYLRYNLLDILECYDKDGDETIGKDEFKILMKNPEVHEILGKFGTDVQDLITLADVIFEDITESDAGKLSFEELLQQVLRLRGSRSAAVTDIVQLREYLRLRMEDVKRELQEGQLALRNSAIVARRAAIPETVVLHLTHDGRERSQIRRSSMSIAELLQQVSQQCRLLAVNSAGLEAGPELTLGELAACNGGEVHLRLVPENPL